MLTACSSACLAPRSSPTVVHVCPDALRVVHGLDRPGLCATPSMLLERLETGRIASLAAWLDGLRP